jgi:hypothetical protein
MKIVRHLRFVTQAAAAAGLIYLAGQNSPSVPEAQGRGALAGNAASEIVPGELLVQFRAGASDAAKGRARGRVGAEVDEIIAEESARGDGKGDLELVRVPPGQSVAAAARGLEADASVEFAEPNWVYYHSAVSNDTYYTNG